MRNFLVSHAGLVSASSLTINRFRNKFGMTFKLGLLFLLLFHGITTKAQEHDPKAKAILDELSKKTKTYASIKAEFAITVEDRDKKKETQNGNIQIKGNKYKLEIKGQEVISDGKTTWTYLKDANEVQVNNVDLNSTDAINPSNIFTVYEKGYKYKFDKEEAVKGITIQTINLYPENPEKKKYHTVKLMVDKTKKQITGIKMLMKDGSVNSYEIKKFTTNTEMNDALFTFDPKAHPGAEVVDLRE